MRLAERARQPGVGQAQGEAMRQAVREGALALVREAERVRQPRARQAQGEAARRAMRDRAAEAAERRASAAAEHQAAREGSYATPAWGPAPR